MIQLSGLPNCPRCNESTKFIPAKLITITDLDHIEYFFRSPYFSYLITEAENGGYRHTAAHFFKCNAMIPEHLPELPSDYSPQDWEEEHTSNCKQSGSLGTLVCNSCSHFEKHILGEQHRLS